MTDIGLVGTLGTAAAKATIILAVAGAATLMWRSASAASRHLIWTLGITGALAVPAIGALIARFDAPKIEIEAWRPLPAAEKVKQDFYPIPERSAPTSSIVTSSQDESGDIVLTDAAKAEQVISSRTQHPAPQQGRRFNWMALILPVYLTGLLVSLLPLAVARIRVRRLARRASTANPRWTLILESTPAISRFAARVRILESTEAAMPMTWGVLRPTLLVPASAEKWAEWQCRNILLHELAHVERRDCTTQLLAQAACAIYWFSPMTWIAAHRMKVERELACDDRVINAGSRASDYASNLLDVARSFRAPSMTSSTAIAMARPSQLSARLLAVLDKRRNRRTVSRAFAACTSFAAMAVALPLASLTPASSATAAALEAPATVASPAVNEIAAPAPAAMNAFAGTPAAIVKAAQLPVVSVLSSPAMEEPLKITAPLATAALPAVAAPQREACWEGKDGKENVSIHSSDRDKGRQSYTVRYSTGDCSLELRAEGEFRLRADLSDIESIGRDGWIRIEEREGRSSRRLEIRRADNGDIERRYYVNGDRANYDENARAWLARTLLAVERRTAFAADTRVPQLYKSGGLRGVLSEISAMSSAYPKSRYYSTLLDMGISLDTNTLNSIVRQVSADLSSSDYYMSEVLGKFGSQPSADENTWRAFADAAGRMKSDYYRSQLLKKVLSKGRLSSSTVNLLLRNASGMKSDYYLTDLLKEVSGRYALNDDTRQYYLEALRSIESDYYRSELLKAMRPDGEWDPKATAYVLEAVAGIKSDYYKSESLKSLARAKAINNWPSYFAAALTIDSDHYKRETLNAALKQSPLTRDIVAGVLNAAPRIKSDSEMAEILSAVARSYTLDEGLRDAYERAVDAMDSDHYRGAALSALRRGVSR